MCNSTPLQSFAFVCCVAQVALPGEAKQRIKPLLNDFLLIIHTTGALCPTKEALSHLFSPHLRCRKHQMGRAEGHAALGRIWIYVLQKSHAWS